MAAGSYAELNLEVLRRVEILHGLILDHIEQNFHREPDTVRWDEVIEALDSGDPEALAAFNERVGRMIGPVLDMLEQANG